MARHASAFALLSSTLLLAACTDSTTEPSGEGSDDSESTDLSEPTEQSDDSDVDVADEPTSSDDGTDAARESEATDVTDEEAAEPAPEETDAPDEAGTDDDLETTTDDPEQNDGQQSNESQEPEELMPDEAQPDAGSPAEPEPDPVSLSGEPVIVGVGSWALRGLGAEGGSQWSYCGNPSTGDDHTPDLLRNVAYGNGVFVAVGGDRNSMVMRSVDGMHWEEDLHPTSACEGEPYPASCTNWMGGIAYGDGAWLAGGGNGALMRSIDGGESWQGLHPETRPPAVRDVAFGSGRFAVGADAGTVGISDDAGDSWTLHSLWEHSLSVSHGGGTFIAWGANWNGSGFDRACFVSTDMGDSFEPCSAELEEVDSFVFDGNRWIATVPDGYAESEDGKEWTVHAADGIPGSLLFDGERLLGRGGSTVSSASAPDAWQPLAMDVPGFRAWTVGRVLDDNLPVSGVPACEDLR